jgi:pimeloyl-ACP methyl ester carboxylesterase
MHPSSLFPRPLSLLLGLALFGLPQPAGTARAADKFSKVTFDTVDGVTLQGTFYAGKSKDEPAVLLLHKLGSDSHKDGWDALAAALNDKGYAVLSFDFRGHGNSTSVDKDKFWMYPWNRNYVRRTGGKPKDTINREEFAPGYYPYLLNDIAAAKMFLDDRNDASDCNSRALIVIGAEDGAALGALWMYSEWNRYPASRVISRGPNIPPLVGTIEKDSEGKDQYAALWLSMTPRLGTADRGVSVGNPVRGALRYVGRDKKVPMGFLYGEKDEPGAEHAKEFLVAAKGTEKDDRLPFTTSKSIKESKLTGSGLLRKDLGTQDLILKYLEKLREKSAPHKWSKVEASGTAYVWTFPGSPIRLGKEEKGKTLEPIPLGPLGITNP